MQQVRPEETVLDLHGLEYDKNGVLRVSRKTPLKLVQLYRASVPTASAAVFAEAWPAMTIATARSFLGLVSVGIVNLRGEAMGESTRDTLMVLSTPQL